MKIGGNKTRIKTRRQSPAMVVAMILSSLACIGVIGAFVWMINTGVISFNKNNENESTNTNEVFSNTSGKSYCVQVAIIYGDFVEKIKNDADKMSDDEILSLYSEMFDKMVLTAKLAPNDDLKMATENLHNIAIKVKENRESELNADDADAVSRVMGYIATDECKNEVENEIANSYKDEVNEAIQNAMKDPTLTTPVWDLPENSGSDE